MDLVSLQTNVQTVNALKELLMGLPTLSFKMVYVMMKQIMLAASTMVSTVADQMPLLKFVRNVLVTVRVEQLQFSMKGYPNLLIKNLFVSVLKKMATNPNVPICSSAPVNYF